MTGLTRDSKHFYQWNGGDPVPGVTGILDALDKSGPLVGWAKREVAACAVRNVDLIKTMVATGGPAAAERWLKTIPDYQRDSAADLGSRIHTFAEARARGIEIEPTPEEMPFVEAYDRWVAEYAPEFVNVEFMVYSAQHSYGGTADAVLRLNGELWLIDNKTSRQIYASTALQLVAYAKADWAGLPNDERKFRIPAVTRFGVLHIRPGGAQLHEYAIGDDEWRAFLALRELRRWLDERSDFVKTLREAA